MTLTLLLMLCCCAWLAWRAARASGINGWIQRYLLAMLVNSAVCTLAWLVSDRLYDIVYVIALVPVLALILAQSVAYLWPTGWHGRLIVLAASLIVGTFGTWALQIRAETRYYLGLPWEVELMIAQFPVLIFAGFAALAGEPHAEHRNIAHWLGCMWLTQALLDKTLITSGFLYDLKAWRPINDVLPAAIVAVFLFGLSRQFALIRHERILLRQAAERHAEAL